MNFGKRMFAAGLTLYITMSCIVPAYGTNTEVNDAKKKASSMEEEKKEVEAALKELEGLKADAAAYVKGLDETLDTYNKQLTALTSQIASKEDSIKEAEADLKEAKDVEETQYRNMKLRIQYMYEKGETNYLDLLFKSADLTQFFNRAEYISSIAAYDRKMLENYKRIREEINNRETILKEEHETLVGFQTAAEEKKQDVERLLEAKNTELASYQNKIAENKENLSELEKDLKAQEQHIKEMEALIRKQEEEARKAAQQAGKTYNTVAIGNIKFIWPCPSSKRITSSFGDRESPTEGASSNHQGIDIGASTGASILAAASGTVTISTYSYSAGNYIMIHHGGGVYTVYMHCSELLVTAGQEVSEGQVIGKVGSTGYSTGPHLHFGIRVNGSYTNPVKYVSP